MMPNLMRTTSSGNANGAVTTTGGGRTEEKKEEDTLTLDQIILWSTHESMRDSDTMSTLIITHKTITDSVTLLQHLKQRFFVAIPRDIAHDANAVKHFRVHVQKSIQLKVVKALRDWMKQFWDEDFSLKYAKQGEIMQAELALWVDEIDELAREASESKWLQPLANTVRKEFERFKVKGAQANPNFDDKVTKRVRLGELLSEDESGEVNLIDAILPVRVDENVVVPEGLRLSSLSPEELADQITLMDYRIFSQIEPRECIAQSWKKKNNKQNAPHIIGMIQQFNHLTCFVQLNI